jgi:hypothetical protein
MALYDSGDRVVNIDPAKWVVPTFHGSDLQREFSCAYLPGSLSRRKRF